MRLGARLTTRLWCNSILAAAAAILAAGVERAVAQPTDEDLDELEQDLADLRDQMQGQSTDILRHFGVGLSLTHDLGGSERVDSAEIVNGIVRVTDNSDTKARVMLEWHAWMLCQRLKPGEEEVVEPPYRLIERRKKDGTIRYKQRPPCRPTRRSSGAFVAVQPGSDAVIDAIGLGWMFRLPDKLQLFGNRTLNIGFGLVSDSDVQVLGDGFEPNQPPPNGETEIRYKNTAQTGVFAMMSIELGQTPTQLPRRPSLTLTADSLEVVAGGSVLLSWRTEGMASCTATDAWMGKKATTGSEQVPVNGAAGTRAFTLACEGPGGTASRFVTINAKAPQAPPATPVTP